MTRKKERDILSAAERIEAAKQNLQADVEAAARRGYTAEAIRDLDESRREFRDAVLDLDQAVGADVPDSWFRISAAQTAEQVGEHVAGEHSDSD
jgi:uncharacterized protein (UPF0335 family)